MDEGAYKAWWPLHLRAVTGEPLDPLERATYEAGLKVLDDAEVLQPKARDAASATADLLSLQRENAWLRAKRKQLEREIEVLEAELSKSGR